MFNKTRKAQMQKIRMNTELRNKLFNKIKNVFENEDHTRKWINNPQDNLALNNQDSLFVLPSLGFHHKH